MGSVSAILAADTLRSLAVLSIEMSQLFESYERFARHLLDRFAEDFGLDRVEGKQSVHGERSGTEYVIDGKGILEGGQGFIIIECRRYTNSRQNQEKLGSLAYRIIDTGAEGAILVSVLGLQKGAKKIAAAETIVEVQLSANCTPGEFVMRFLNKVMVSRTDHVGIGDRLNVELEKVCTCCGKHFIAQPQEYEGLCDTCHQASAS